MKSDSLLKYAFFSSLRGVFIEGTPVAVLCGGFGHVGRYAVTLWVAQVLSPLGHHYIASPAGLGGLHFCTLRSTEEAPR